MRWRIRAIKGDAEPADVRRMTILDQTPAAAEAAGDEGLEQLARRLLELLGRVTGLESTYLTSIDLDGGVQKILFSRNVGALDLPEGLEVAWSDTRQVTVSVVSVDVDRFKAINDRFGHAAGDEVLQEVARRLTAHCRAGDVVTRYGGDEFVAVLVGADAAAASAIAQRLRSDLASADVLTSVGLVPVTISVGVAASADVGDPDDLLRSADLALYVAKAAGRDVDPVG